MTRRVFLKGAAAFVLSCGLDFAAVSVFPCRGDCAHCGRQTLQRAGKRLCSDRNFLFCA